MKARSRYPRLHAVDDQSVETLALHESSGQVPAPVPLRERVPETAASAAIMRCGVVLRYRLLDGSRSWWS